MNTIECSSCRSSWEVRISPREGIGLNGQWTGSCPTCGNTWDFDD